MDREFYLNEAMKALEKASGEKYPYAREMYLSAARTYIRLASEYKEPTVEAPKTEVLEAVIANPEPDKKSFWLELAPSIATSFSAIMTVVAAMFNGKAVVAAKKEDRAARMDQLKLICKASESTLPDTLSLKTLNENMK